MPVIYSLIGVENRLLIVTPALRVSIFGTQWECLSEILTGRAIRLLRLADSVRPILDLGYLLLGRQLQGFSFNIALQPGLTICELGSAFPFGTEPKFSKRWRLASRLLRHAKLLLFLMGYLAVVIVLGR